MLTNAGDPGKAREVNTAVRPNRNPFTGCQVLDAAFVPIALPDECAVGRVSEKDGVICEEAVSFARDIDTAVRSRGDAASKFVNRSAPGCCQTSDPSDESLMISMSLFPAPAPLIPPAM